MSAHLVNTSEMLLESVVCYNIVYFGFNKFKVI